MSVHTSSILGLPIPIFEESIELLHLRYVIAQLGEDYLHKFHKHDFSTYMKMYNIPSKVEFLKLIRKGEWDRENMKKEELFLEILKKLERVFLEVSSDVKTELIFDESTNWYIGGESYLITKGENTVLVNISDNEEIEVDIRMSFDKLVQKLYRCMSK